MILIEDYELCEGPMNCFGDYVGSWVDCGDVWLSIDEQGTKKWKDSREGRLTASDFGAAAGKSRFKTRDELLEEKRSGVPPVFTAEAIEHMSRGTREEPSARKYYVKDTGYEVVERGLVVPKWNPLIGASVDGDIVNSDGCIEIKCPKRIYWPLKRNKGEGGHEHIYDTHYCQMQGGAAIYGKSWFDYVVFGVEERKMYIERVPFNEEYWMNFLYPRLESFCEDLSR